MNKRARRTLETAYEIERAVIRRAELFGTFGESWTHQNTRQYQACIRMLRKYNGYYGFRVHAVYDCLSVEDFLDKYTKPSRYWGRGPEYVAARFASHLEAFNKDGYTFITQHDSVTGEIVSFYGGKECSDYREWVEGRSNRPNNDPEEPQLRYQNREGRGYEL